MSATHAATRTRTRTQRRVRQRPPTGSLRLLPALLAEAWHVSYYIAGARLHLFGLAIAAGIGVLLLSVLIAHAVRWRLWARQAGQSVVYLVNLAVVEWLYPIGLWALTILGP